MIGDDPATGLFLGALFVQPELDLALTMPAGWKTINSPEVAAAVAPDGNAAVLLNLVGPGEDPVAGAKADGVPDAQMKRLQRLQIAGLPAARLVADTRESDRVTLTWIAHRKRILRVTGMTRRSDWEHYGPAFERTAASFRPLTAADRERIVESRLRTAAGRRRGNGGAGAGPGRRHVDRRPDRGRQRHDPGRPARGGLAGQGPRRAALRGLSRRGPAVEYRANPITRRRGH